MQKTKVALVAAFSVLSMFAVAGGASARPLDVVCENFPGPRDGKAWWYHAVCS